MNERIKELMLEAGYAAPELAGRANKLAELIINECLDTIQRGIDNFGSANEDTLMGGRLALFYSYRNIQNRFGMGDYKDKQNLGVEE